jgi:futalosine hydrolase
MKEQVNILIVAATEEEVKPFLEEFAFQKVTDYEFDTIYQVIIDEWLELEVLITGVGMTATAFHVGRILDDNYNMTINAGLAGSFNRNLDLGSVVNITEDSFSELGAEDGEEFLTLKKLDLPGVQTVTNDSQINNSVLGLLPRVNGITVNKVHGHEKSIGHAFFDWRPITESMEGAAFLYAAQMAKIPCAQVRAISNYVERRNREAWNIPLAIGNLNRTLSAIVKAFLNE